MWKSCTVRSSPLVPKHCSIHAWDSGFYRRTLPSQSNASQVLSESCREKLHCFQLLLAIIKNPAFAASLLKLFKLYNLNKKVILKIVLHTVASKSTKKNQGEKIQISEYLTKKQLHLRLWMQSEQRLRADFLYSVYCITATSQLVPIRATILCPRCVLSRRHWEHGRSGMITASAAWTWLKIFRKPPRFSQKFLRQNQDKPCFL